MEEAIAQSIYELEKSAFSDSWSYDSIYQSSEFDYYYIYVAYMKDNEIKIFRGNSDKALPSDKEEYFAGYIISVLLQDETELLRIAVKEQYRSMGVGNALMDYYLAQMSEKCERGFLEVRESNNPAIRLYENKKYIKIAQRNNYYTNPVENGLVYQIEL